MVLWEAGRSFGGVWSARSENETNYAGRTSNSRSRPLTKIEPVPAGKSALPI